MKIIDIQKNLLISHLGLVGINEELLDTFPVKNLIDKSDDSVCVNFSFHFTSFSKEKFLKALGPISRILEIEAKSLSKKGSSEDIFVAQVFYDSHTMHWSDRASLKFEELQGELKAFDVKISAVVSVND